MTGETMEKTFLLTGPARLELSNLRGSVDIQRGDDLQIQVTAVKQAHTGDADGTEIEWSQNANGTVTIATRFRDAWSWLAGAHPCCVEYVVKAPRSCSLRVKGVSNTLSVEGLEGEFDFYSVSGDVSLRSLTGPVRIHTVSGEVSAVGLAGALHLDTVSGDAEFKQANLPSVDASTVSGTVDLQTPLGDGSYRFRSVSGDLHLRVPPESHCSLELHSLSGKIRTDFPQRSSLEMHGSQAAEVQGGGVPISLNSVSGNLRLDCDGEVPEDVPARRPLSAEERRAVLERIERGEVTIAEALTQLRG